MKVLVLGAGRVGAAIVRDLAADPAFSVTAADHSADALRPLSAEGIPVEVVALEEPGELEEALDPHDLVVGAVPGELGFEALRRVIEAGKDAVDISFFPEDAFALDAVARERGVRAVVDAGVAPGLGNLILGHLEASLDAVESFRCVVGGLPVTRSGVWEYKAPSSPVDVIEEYTRPARLRRGGQDLFLAALDELELMELPGVGTLEAFLTDGLRTLLRTSKAPTLEEKTLRYPGHVAKVRLLRDSGFLDTGRVEAGGCLVRPIDLTARLLERAWRFDPGEEDLTVMRVEVVGTRAGERVQHVFDLLDRTDPATGTSSMARTTGYTCTALVRWLARGVWTTPGIAPPELLGREAGCFDFVREQLRERGVRLTDSVGPVSHGR